MERKFTFDEALEMADMVADRQDENFGKLVFVLTQLTLEGEFEGNLFPFEDFFEKYEFRLVPFHQEVNTTLSNGVTITTTGFHTLVVVDVNDLVEAYRVLEYEGEELVSELVTRVFPAEQQ